MYHHDNYSFTFLISTIIVERSGIFSEFNQEGEYDLLIITWFAKHVDYLTSTTTLELNEIPSHLAMIRIGYVLLNWFKCFTISILKSPRCNREGDYSKSVMSKFQMQ